MNVLFRVILAVALISGFFTLVGVLVPQSITTNMTGAMVFYLNYLNYLSPLIHMSVVFTCLDILANFILALAIAYMFKWLLHLILG